MKLLIILLFSILPSVLSTQWIDPHDMNTNSKKNLKKSSSSGDLQSYEAQQNCQINKEKGDNSVIYLKRFVNLLLNSASKDSSDPMMYHSKLHFSLDNESFQFLKSFSSGEEIDVDQLRKLDTILSEMFRRTYFDELSDMYLPARDEIFHFLFSKNSLPLLGLCVFLYIAYNLFRSNFSIWYVFRYFVFLIIVFDYVQRYQQLQEEAEEHNMHLKYSSKCDTSKMTWAEYFKFLSGHEDCEKKMVSLLEVGLIQVKSIIIVPLSALGTGMGEFGSGLWKNLPFPWNILIFPLMLIFCVFLAVIVMTTINGTPFRVNLMHLFHFEFGEKKNGVGGVTLERLLNAVARPMVEDVREKRKERYPQKGRSQSKAIDAKKPPQNKNKEKSGDKVTDKDKNSDNDNSAKNEKKNKASNSQEKIIETTSTHVE